MCFNRVLLRFSKEGDASYLSHHDLMRLFERALRRAALPVRMTQGFNPRPKMSILLALSLGVAADEEPVVLEFEPPVRPEDVARRMGAELPEGIALGGAQMLPEGVRPRVTSVVYEAELPPDAAVSEAGAERLMARDAITVERVSPKRRRTIDLRPALVSLGLAGRRLRFELRVGAGTLPKPTEVVAALLAGQADAVARARVRRVRVMLADRCAAARA